jgi:pyruvate formate lyase activating enzyme
LKYLNEAKHTQITGVSNKKILNNVNFLDSIGQNVIIRVPLIPGFTDTENNIHEIGSYISSLTTIDRVDILPYNRLGEEKYHRLNREFKLGEKGRIQTQSDRKLQKIKNMLEGYELKVNIGG